MMWVLGIVAELMRVEANQSGRLRTTEDCDYITLKFIILYLNEKGADPVRSPLFISLEPMDEFRPPTRRSPVDHQPVRLDFLILI
jgi:hypothetical protein